jgi:SAM-dependent methyltransferase
VPRLGNDERARTVLSAQYDESYYRHYSEGDPPYLPGEEHWERFFAYVAKAVVAELAPKTALDVGCGVGFLVGALRDLGVDATGIDVSEFAISSVPERLRRHCRLGSATDPIEGHFDLILCIEVLEHLAEEEAQIAVANMAGHADRILFSSTATDFADPTHKNVRRAHYWAESFARWGMFRDPDLDCSFLASQAVYFAKAEPTPVELATRYERWAERLYDEVVSLRSERQAYKEHRETTRELEGEVRALGESLQRTTLSLSKAAAELSRAGEESARLSALADARLGLIDEERRRAEQAESELAALRSTRTFRYSRGARACYGQLRRALARVLGRARGC